MDKNFPVVEEPSLEGTFDVAPLATKEGFPVDVLTPVVGSFELDCPLLADEPCPGEESLPTDNT